MQGVRGRCWTTTITTALLAVVLGGLGVAMLLGAVPGEFVGIALIAAGVVGVASLWTQRTARLYSAVVAVAGFVALLSGWQVVEGADLALVVESSIEMALVLFGLLAALAPACLGEDVGNGDDVPRVRLCIHGHRMCPFHPAAPITPPSLPEPAAAPLTQPVEQPAA